MEVEWLDCPNCGCAMRVEMEMGDKTWRNDIALHEWECEHCGATVITQIVAVRAFEYYLEDFTIKEEQTESEEIKG